ncbi:hypothetical protein BOX15_Mlig031008g2 [Macrostomum lignano]|uniref:non-specific serine/threonine protein kinase n=1 Tax=Macrostomum lignano TaxID=282301 RepID=A0A267DM33_9PLAT|nr:hypothetical protein BOX15_Mlig031008g3 [Macrostomum lignano]PAA50370.1 hypothetical protein BOX15_Mlig031008g2 [Macrostomum lignano]
MENYLVVKQLGSGPLGTVLLVEAATADRLRYALKRVECHDESSANKAFKESLRLTSIRHPFAAPYREIFVDWNADHSSVYVCFVMDHFPNGSLESITSRKLKDKKPLDEEIVRKWFGQTLEFLAYIHGRGLCHGDIRASNIFLRDDLSISVGDFCVATLMADHQTNTRTDKAIMDATAPEVQAGRPATYTQAADMWGLGCVLLNLMLCTEQSWQSLGQTLLRYKSSESDSAEDASAAAASRILQEALAPVESVYSPELRAAVLGLLAVRPTDRPTMAALLETPLARDCLNLAGSAMADRRRKQQVTTKDRPIPRDSGLEPLLEYVDRELNNENCFREALEELCTQLRSAGSLTAEQLCTLHQGLRSHLASEEVCTAYCCLLGNLAIRASPGGPLYSRESVDCVLLAMSQHPYCSGLLRSAAALLMAFAADRRCSQLVGESGGIDALLSAVAAAPDDVDLFALAANALWSLCAYAPNARRCLERDGLLLVTRAMKAFGDSPEAQEHGAALLLAFSMSPSAVQRAGEHAVVELLLRALARHQRFTKVVRNAALALASYVESDEECGLTVLDCESVEAAGEGLAGLPVLAAAFHVHRDNVEVAEAMASLLRELCMYPELVKSVIDINQMIELINTVRKRFLKTPAVAKPLDEALRSLETVRFVE